MAHPNKCRYTQNGRTGSSRSAQRTQVSVLAVSPDLVSYCSCSAADPVAKATRVQPQDTADYSMLTTNREAMWSTSRVYDACYRDAQQTRWLTLHCKATVCELLVGIFSRDAVLIRELLCNALQCARRISCHAPPRLRFERLFPDFRQCCQSPRA